MGSRQATAVLWAIILAGAMAFLFTSPEAERAGAATTTVRTCGGGSITLDVKEERMLMLHNRARKVRGLRPLCVDRRLTRAARSHSREMIKKDYFSHPSYNGESVAERLVRFGYHKGTYGENLAGGSGRYAGPDNAFQRLMNSPRHRAIILDGKFRLVGVGAYTGNYKGFRGYTMYTVDFGVPG
jgi:uncharacterized protein YkwD